MGPWVLINARWYKYAFRRFKTLRRDEVGRFKLLRITINFRLMGK